MIIHNFEQGAPEWFNARIGVITASSFDKIITPKKLELSSQSTAIENKIAAEIITGESCDDFQGNSWTERGHELEPDAADFYEMTTGIVPEKVGFITNDDGTIGASPDRLIGDDGLLEIKCPAPQTHITYLLNGTVADKYKAQVQGQLMVTGRKWCDVMSYHPEIRPSIVRVERDEEYIAALSVALVTLCANVQTKLKQIRG